MVGVLLVCAFLAIVFAYFCTEYLLGRLGAQYRMLSAGSQLRLLIVANLASLMVMWVSSIILVTASGAELYLAATAICLAAQAVWLTQHLWSYHRDRLRGPFRVVRHPFSSPPIWAGLGRFALRKQRPDLIDARA